MDNRKLRYAKRKAKEKILSQRDRAYYRNLHFRKNPNEQAEASPEHYAAQNASLYGRKYALPIFSRKSKGTGAAGVKNIKTLSKGTKKAISIIITGGSTMLVLFAIIIPLCAAAAVFGSDDDSEVNSNNALVAIAQSQIGNEGGEIYWRWYGFDSHDACRRKWYAAGDKWIMGYGGAIKTKSNDL